jgi:hypothetical protein
MVEDSIMSNIDVTPCAVIIDEAIDKGAVELSKKMFKRYGLDPGDEIVVSGGGQRVRLVAWRGESLKACQIATNPYLAVFMGVGEGDDLDVQGAMRLEQVSSGEVETFKDILDQPQERLEPLLGEELRNFRGLTVQGVLEHLLRYGGADKDSYLVVAPNPDDTGIPRGEACEDPSLSVKKWDPSGDGS